jgi:hypothetical protein
MQPKRPLLLLLVVALGLSLCATTALAEDVGNFTRVVNEVEHLKQGKGPPKLAKVPEGVENQDLVETRNKAMAVVQFVDESTITISPKSKVTIEDYMYDASEGKSKGAIKIMEGVVETVIPNKGGVQNKDIHIYTTTAVAGIRGTRLITVAKPGGQGTIFYVLPEEKAKPRKSKIKIRLFSPEIMPKAPIVQFVAERLHQKMELTQIVNEALEKGFGTCDIVKAFIVSGANPEQLAVAFEKVCRGAPEYKDVCSPAVILKCTVETMRARKEVELAEMQYGLIMKNLAPITGEIKPQDLNKIMSLVTTGIQGEVPYSVPTQAQINEAKLPEAAQQVAESLVKAGADPTLVNEGLQDLGVSQPQAVTYTAESSAQTSSQLPGVGGSGQTQETPASPAQ